MAWRGMAGWPSHIQKVLGSTHAKCCACTGRRGDRDRSGGEGSSGMWSKLFQAGNSQEAGWGMRPVAGYSLVLGQGWRREVGAIEELAAGEGTSFLFSWFCETGFLHIVWAVLELTM